MLARIRKMQEEGESGFTLIELLIVMIIIGILAAIAIPTFLNQRKNAYNTAVKSDLRNAATALESAAVDAGGSYVAGAGTFTAGMSMTGVGGFQPSDGVTVQLESVDTQTYCLDGYNTKSDSTSGTTTTHVWFKYNKANGVVASGQCP